MAALRLFFSGTGALVCVAALPLFKLSGPVASLPLILVDLVP